MGSFMLIISVIVATHPVKAGTVNPSPSGIAAICMIFGEAMAFNMSWGPLAWYFSFFSSPFSSTETILMNPSATNIRYRLYLGEIFPNRTREVGIAVGAASQWLFNFMMSQITPHAIANIGAWHTFLMFCIFNYAIVIYSYFFLKEVRIFFPF